jgi:hypothetical protein
MIDPNLLFHGLKSRGFGGVVSIILQDRFKPQ